MVARRGGHKRLRSGIVVLLLAVVALLWWVLGPFSPWRRAELMVVNLSPAPVGILLHGAGLQRAIALEELAPGHARRLTLTLANGPVRLRSTQPGASADSVLVLDSADLARASLRLEIRPHNRFVLATRD